MRFLAAALFFGLLSPAAAQSAGEIRIDHEEWRVIGWNDACGVALTLLSYPKLGDAQIGEPVSTRIGWWDIAPGQEKSAAHWTLEADGAMSWSARAAAKAEKNLKQAGFGRPGFPEFIQDAPVGNQPLLAERILSTGTLSPRLKDGWPDPAQWRWIGGNYNPLATCALLAFENRSAPRRYRHLLIRVYNSRARTDRAYAHASSARVLFNDGVLATAVVESATAAELDPSLPIARYEHAAMLALTGRANEAVAELAIAIKLNPKYAEKARDNIDFIDLRDRDDFKDAVR